MNWTGHGLSSIYPLSNSHSPGVMNTGQAETSDIGQVELVMASQSVIDAVAASLFADMERHTIRTTIEPSPSAEDDVWTIALASTVEGLRTRLCLLVKTACEKRNSKPPINRLPVELLTIIFQLVVDSATPDLRIRSVQTLALVATRWKGIVDLTPSLWATICDSYPPPIVAAVLIKSKHSPLTVHSLWQSVPVRQRMEEILHMVQPHIYRLQTLQIILNDPRHISLLNAPAPKLRSLHLQFRYHSDRTAAPVNVFSGSAESLQDLKLDGIQIPWESEMLTRLRSLYISHINGPRSEMTSRVIIRTLAQCPELEDLELVSIDLAMDQQEGSTTVLASRLARICISSLPYSFFHFFLASVTAPQITSITLGPPNITRGKDTTTLSLDALRRGKEIEGAADMQHVRIEELAINWTSGALKGLRSLSVTQGAPTSDQLMAILLENPSLEVLRLWSINVIPSVEGPPAPPVIRLSQLREASLYTIPSDVVNTILSAVLVPQLETCLISMALGSGLPSPIISIDPSSHNTHGHVLLGRWIQQGLSRSSKIDIKVDTNGDMTVGSYGRLHAVSIVFLQGGVLSPAALAGQFLSALHSDHLPLNISFEDDDEPQNFTVQTLKHISEMLPQTTGIDLGFGFGDLEPALRFLARPQTGPEQSHGPWPLPLLTSVHATSTAPFADILAMVRGRAGLDLTGQWEGAELPAPFESITFEYQDEELTAEGLEAMEAVVAPGVFHWGGNAP